MSITSLPPDVSRGSDAFGGNQRVKSHTSRTAKQALRCEVAKVRKNEKPKNRKTSKRVIRAAYWDSFSRERPPWAQKCDPSSHFVVCILFACLGVSSEASSTRHTTARSCTTLPHRYPNVGRRQHGRCEHERLGRLAREILSGGRRGLRALGVPHRVA